MSLWEYREAMQKGHALGKKGSNEVVLAQLIHQQRQIADESRVLTKAESRSRKRRDISFGQGKTHRLNPARASA
ncbi:hypothetical protein [Phyllobacterium ifriqiyense]|uniref:hypothetical protein n=1 Tax=Phyllobacterium ifriqiyense TaxID=314238 RepID=UPI003399D17E